MQGGPRFLGLGLATCVGVAIGYAASAVRPTPLRAEAADRIDERAVASGPISLEINKDKISFPQDAIYYLNYSRGRLLACVPVYERRGTREIIKTDFAERDLVSDFQLGPGANPHFLMTTANMGMYSQGWAPLFVFETESGQVATYRVMAITDGTNSRPTFVLLERHSDPKLARGVPAPATEDTR